MPPPPPRGAPPKPLSNAPAISTSALAAIRKKIGEPAKISRQEVEDNDESFQDDDLADRDRSLYDDDAPTNDEHYRGRYLEDKANGRRDRGRGEEDDMDDGDGYGDGRGKYASEYDDSIRDDDLAFDPRDREKEYRDDSYLNEVNASAAQPKSVQGPRGSSGWSSADKSSGGVSLRNFQTPYEYKGVSRLPYLSGNPEIFNFRPILKATYRELRNFVFSPVDPGKVVRCYIERNRQGRNRMAPFYSMCADLEDGTGRELMVCRKVFYSFQSHHIFSLKGEDLYRKREQRSRLYLGKLRGNSDRTEFVLYDSGSTSAPDEDKEQPYTPGSGEDPDYKPDKYFPGAVDIEEQKAAQTKPAVKDDATSLYRKELLVVYYNSKKRPSAPGQRGSEIAIPSTFLNANTQAYNNANSPALAEAKAAAKQAGIPVTPISSAPLLPNSNISVPFQRARSAGKQNEKQTKHVFVMHERTSKYDPLSSCLVDFKSRANIASTKNAQFIESSPLDGPTAMSTDKEYESNFILQIGKTTEDCFNVDVRYPMTLLQAFAVCVSRFDAKLSW